MTQRTKKGGGRQVMGKDPLDRVIPPPSSSGEKERTSQEKGAPREGRGNSGDASPRRVRTNFQIPEEVIEEARDAVVHLAGAPAYLNLAALVENALRKELGFLKRKYNDGRDFPRRPHPLRRGRPVK